MPVGEPGSTSTFPGASLSSAGLTPVPGELCFHPRHIQHFLLSPSICDQLCSPPHLSVGLCCHDLGIWVPVTRKSRESPGIVPVPVQEICFHHQGPAESKLINTAVGIARLPWPGLRGCVRPSSEWGREQGREELVRCWGAGGRRRALRHPLTLFLWSC